MSTRSMTVIEGPGGPFRLYRHCDGYPSFAGQSLAAALAKAKNATQGAAAILRETYEATSYCPARPTYELADWTPNEQGDLEHVYTAHAPHCVATSAFPVGWTIEHRQRIGWDQYGNAVWRTTKYTLDEFTAFCAREYAAHEAWEAAYEKRRGATV